MYHVKGIVKKSEDKEGVLEASVASTEVVDRMGEVIKQDGWELKNFNKNPVLLWAHNAGLTADIPPIGKVLKVWMDGLRKKRLMFKVQFDMADPFAAEIARKFKEGYLNAFSVGFQPLEREDNVYTKSELLEISAVPVPANPEALSVLRSLQPTEWDKLYPAVKEKSKTAVPFKETPKMPEQVDWDKSAANKRVREWATGEDGKLDMKKFKEAFAWFDESKAQKSSSYKLPHHDIEDGELKTSWRGVAAAMAALLGARGGSDIPEAERKAVYNHLKKHYKQFDKEAPEFRMVEEQVLKTLEVEIDSYTRVSNKKEVKKIVEKVVKEAATKEQPQPTIRVSAADIVGLLEQITLKSLEKYKEIQSKGGDK